MQSSCARRDRQDDGRSIGFAVQQPRQPVEMRYVAEPIAWAVQIEQRATAIGRNVANPHRSASFKSPFIRAQAPLYQGFLQGARSGEGLVDRVQSGCNL